MDKLVETVDNSNARASVENGKGAFFRVEKLRNFIWIIRIICKLIGNKNELKDKNYEQ